LANTLLLIPLLLATFLPPALLAAEEKPPVNVLVVGWDGTRLARLETLLKKGKLPNLAALIKKGSFVPVTIQKAKTDTKAGWAEIFTGYDASINKVRNNRQYESIPMNLTLWERLKAKFGAGITNVMIVAKPTHLGIREKHNVCINCISRLEGNRELSEWWNEAKFPPTRKKGEERKLAPRYGEPFMNAARAIDFYKDDVGGGPKVLALALEQLAKLQGKSFFAFVHFEEPDEQGHLFGEHSKQYSEGLINDDKNLGALLKQVETLGLGKNLKVFVMADHGFDIIGSGRVDDREHDTDASRSTFLASSEPGFRKKNGDRRDFVPTVLKMYGIDPASFTPSLQGKPYF